MSFVYKIIKSETNKYFLNKGLLKMRQTNLLDTNTVFSYLIFEAILAQNIRRVLSFT